MKKAHSFRNRIAVSLAVLTAVSSAQFPVHAETGLTNDTGEITVNPEIHYQTLEGWGSSLCWWGNVIGSAGDEDFNGNGRPDREEIAELAFSPEYLNLNIVRYNVGGGDKADSSIKRVEGRVPGWSKDMFGNEDGSGEFLGESFYQKPSEEMNDAGQIWMLEQANQWRQSEGDIINKVFSNSPPYYMTKSGSSTGGNNWNAWEKENLKDDYYDDFALYLARATKWLNDNLNNKFGTRVDYVEPLNEPDTDYWLNGSTKQEGCIFYPGESQIKAYREMKTALADEGLTDVKLTGTDETSLDKAIWSYEHLDTQTRGDLDVISAHTYGGNDTERVRLKNLAASYDKGLWMSEVTKGGGWHGYDGWSHGNMGQCQTKAQSEGIMSDLKKMQSSAWIAWLLADSEYECLQTEQNWGLIHYVFEEDGPVSGYHTNLFEGDGSVKEGVPEQGYWAVTKQFYTMMQYSKFLKAGYTMIEIGDDNMCAAISPERDELVIVAQNFSGGTRDTSIDLSKFPNAANVKLYRTSDSESCEEAAAVLSGSVLDVSMPDSYSVSTYVITGDGGPLYEETGYKTIVDSNAEATADALAAGASDMNKFTYTGSWGDGWEWGQQEKYTTEAEAAATFKFTGVQADIYGKKSENGAELLISVDGGEAVPVSAYAAGEMRRTLLYTTPVLADGEHTVTITMADGQTAGSPELVLEYAQISHGTVPVEGSGLTKEDVIANDYVLYTVNCGTPDPSVVPNSNNERMGLLQSNVDQEYGVDPETGRSWGCDPATEYSAAWKHGDDATDLGNSFIYMSDQVTFDKYKSGLSYSFELPEEKIDGIEEDTYEVTLEFKHFWDERWVNIALEEKTVATDVHLNYEGWVRKTFTTEVTDGQLNVRIQSPRRNGTGQDPILNFIKVRALPDTEPEVTTYDSFTGVNGEMMYDTNGKAIQAHGGQIQQLTVDGVTKWYWIGEDKTNDYRPVGGIHVYSSDDLYNWDDEGVVLRTMEDPAQFEEDPYFRELYGEYDQQKKDEIFVDLDRNNCVMERPKMIYNEEYDHYVIWFHADGRSPGNNADYGKAKAGIAVSDSPTGPFQLLGSYKLNYHDDPDADHGYDEWEGRGSVRDMNLFVDDDKTAYIIYSSEGNRTTFISRLNDAYTDLEVPREEAVEDEHFSRNFIGWSREAPAMFQYNDKYYMVNSGCTGWSPNPAEYMVADHPMGPWTAMGDPCSGWESDTTFRTQSTCVIPVDAEKGKFIYMGDRWNADELRDSRYVWLPVNFQDGDQLKLERYENWTLEDLDYKGLPRITTELPAQFESLEAMKLALPDVIDVAIGEEELLGTAVQWEEINTERPFIGTYKVSGRLTDRDRTVTYSADIVDPGMLYFFDSGADSSKYYESLSSTAQWLKNDAPDQAYTEENKAGYTGEKGIDFGRRVGHGTFNNGWWAKEDKAIEYRFDMKPGTYTVTTGFQEWWNVSRDMKVTAVLQKPGAEDVLLAEQNIALQDSEAGMIQELEITVPESVGEQGAVAVRVEKTGSADPVLAFIGISSENPQETTYKISGTVTAQPSGEAVKDIRLNLYQGADITEASPANAVSTDEEGVYVFEDLESGVYTVELPASDHYEAAVRTVVIENMDAVGIDFSVGEEEEEPPLLPRHIKVTALPEKTGYKLSEALDLSGLEVTLFQDEEPERVLEEGEYTVSELDSSTAGTKKIWVTYGEDGAVYKTSFRVTVYDKEQEPSIKVVRKPDRQSYYVGEELDTAGMEVRGRNIGEEKVLELDDGDYEVEYDFTEPGTAAVTVIYTMEDAPDVDIEDTEAEPSTQQLKDTFEVYVMDTDTQVYAKDLQIVEKPYRTVYEVDDTFDAEGMTVQKTMVVIASDCNATYSESVPLDELEIDAEEFTRTGSKKVVVSYETEGEHGAAVTLSDTLTVTVTKNRMDLLEDQLEAVLEQLEQKLSYGAYVKEEELHEAYSQAAEDMKEYLDNGEDRVKLSSKALDMLKQLDDGILEAYPNITAAVSADSYFGDVYAKGLALSADLSSEVIQNIRLKIKRSQEELPDHISGDVSRYTAMDITLHTGAQQMQPRLPIRIRMDIPSGVTKDNLVIYHFHDETWDKIYPDVSGDQMSFTVTDLSLFVAANTKKPSRPPVSHGGSSVTSRNGGSGMGGPGYTTPGTWKADSLGWWYQKTDGSYIQSSWAIINGLWYYFDDAGYMKTGWITDRGRSYYLNSDGSMAVNTITPDGYRVGGDGAMVP